jgi:hypothetical protein
VVRPEGLEPPAYWFEANRSIQLSYGRGSGDCDLMVSPRGVPQLWPAIVTKHQLDVYHTETHRGMGHLIEVFRSGAPFTPRMRKYIPCYKCFFHNSTDCNA